MVDRVGRWICAAFLLWTAASGRASAQDTPTPDSPRIALVIGIGAYHDAPLPSAANDAGLVAQTLAAAGFDVTGARDLDGAGLRRAVQDFLAKASAGGPRGVAFVYLAGHALQFEGENYFAPADAKLTSGASVPIETFRIADLTRALAATHLGVKLVVIDGAHADPQAKGPLADGLALVDPEPGTLLAFNAAPGTLAPIDAGPYGTYASILAQTMKQGGVAVDEVFDRVRVATNTRTRGAVVPWDVSKLLGSFTFFDRADNAPAMGSAQIPFASLRTRPLRDFSPEQAYDVALARDTLPAYQEYLTVFGDAPLARRIRLILAVRREALFWRDVSKANSPPAYWTYLARYPKGPHGAEALRRLGRLAAARLPSGDFVPLAFDVPPPPQDEMVYFDRRVIFADPDLPPPPPPPLFLLPPIPAEEAVPQPPSPPPGPRFLPVPLAVAIPFVRPIIAPGVIVPPRGVQGGYRQPRPFRAGPATGGLVPQSVSGAPEPASAPEPFVAPKPLPQPPAAQSPPAPHPRKMPPSGGAAPALPVTPASPASPPPAAPSGQPLHRKPGKPAAPPAPLVTSPPSAGQAAAPQPLAPAAKAPPGPEATKPHARPLSKDAPPSPPPAAHAPPPPASELPPARPKPVEPEPRPAAPKVNPVPPGDAEPHAGGQDHRKEHPECGHPGQPPCHP